MAYETHRASSLVRYWVHCIPSQRLHSPYLFSLSGNVLRGKELPEKVRQIEAYRQCLRRDNREIAFNDAGAGTAGQIRTSRKVSDIARNSLLPSSWSARLFRLAKFTGARRILELGTSLGITSQYLASSGSQNTVITIEADAGSAAMAKKGFEINGFKNIDLRNQTFAQFLEGYASGSFDIIYLDGDHRMESTMKYMEQLQGMLNPGGVIVLDDIHWSPGMSQAWEDIYRRNCFAFSMDLWKQGWLFRREMTEKQHFVIRP
jgi:protein-L-isoaspartate O-methyltransferase